MKLRMKSLRSLGFLILLSVLFSQARGAAADPASFGVNIHAPQGAELAAQLDRVKAAGLGWVRIDFIWAAIEPRKGAYNWHPYDALAAAARARGLQVYATIAYTPAWATDGPELTGVPRNPDDWRRICQRAAMRYRGKITYWGLWNEPNLNQFWAGSRDQYIDVILKTGADAIHAGNRGAKVGGPDLAHLVSGDSDWYDWLRESLLEAGDRLDFITHHIYDSSGNRGVTSKLEASTLFGGHPALWGIVAPLGQGGPREHRLDGEAGLAHRDRLGVVAGGGVAAGGLLRGAAQRLVHRPLRARLAHQGLLLRAQGQRRPRQLDLGDPASRRLPQAGLRRLPGVRGRALSPRSLAERGRPRVAPTPAAES